ncbi:MAG: hypothetical protein ACFE98_01580 [Candidatus Hermodarchaeota archaeon]
MVFFVFRGINRHIILRIVLVLLFMSSISPKIIQTFKSIDIVEERIFISVPRLMESSTDLENQNIDKSTPTQDQLSFNSENQISTPLNGLEHRMIMNTQNSLDNASILILQYDATHQTDLETCLRNSGNYVEKMSKGNYSEKFVSLEYLKTFDLVFILRPVWLYWTRVELLALEDYFTSGGWIIQMGIENLNCTYNKWLQNIGMSEWGGYTSSAYTNNFNTVDFSELFIGGVSQLYFSDCVTFQTSSTYQPVVWDQTGTYTLVGAIQRLGTLITISGSFEYNIYVSDNTIFLDNIIETAKTQIKEGVLLTPSNLFSRESTHNLTWYSSLNDSVSVDYFELWLNEINLGTTSSSWILLTNLVTGYHNVTIQLIDNHTRTFKDSKTLIVDFTPPDIIDFWPEENSIITQRYLGIRWNSSDNLSGIVHSIVLMKKPSNQSYEGLYINPTDHQNQAHAVFTEDGVHIFNISVFDWAGNVANVSFKLIVDFTAVGFIRTHYESSLSSIWNYCANQQAFVEYLSYNVPVTYEWLMMFDLVFVGYGGSSPWSVSELIALEDYINSGGCVVYIHRDYYDPPLLPWLSSLGITKVDNGPGSQYTTTFLHSHPLFSNVSQIYLYSAYDSWDLTGDAYPIAWSQDGLYPLIVMKEKIGSLIVIAGDLDYRLYYADNYDLLINILDLSENQTKEGIALRYSSLISNSIDPTVLWFSNLINTTVDHYEVFIDNISQGTTLDQRWNFTSISEGVHNVTIVLHDNASRTFTDTQNLVVDLTSPEITLYQLSDGTTINTTYASVSWKCSDNLSGISEVKAYLKNPANTSWTELWIDPYSANYTDLYFPEPGDYLIKISVWDKAGNQKDEIISLIVEFLMVGFIWTHDESSLGNIRSFCQNQGYMTEYLYYGDIVTREWLDRFNIVFIGYGGYTTWSSTELTALEDYLNSGGYIVYIHRDYYDPPLLPWLSSLGITKVDNGPGSHYTTTFLHSHPLFSNVSQIYLYSAYNSWDLTGDAYPIVWSEDGLYPLVGIVERMGSLIVIAGDLDYRLYYADNEKFLDNLLAQASKGCGEGIALKYSDLITNSTSPTISWCWYLENSSFDYVDIYLDQIFQGSSVSNNFNLSTLSEGVYNLTVRLYDNISRSFVDSNDLIIDLTEPMVFNYPITNESIVTSGRIYFGWNTSDNLSGIAEEKLYWKTPFNQSWDEIWLDPQFYYPYYTELCFSEKGEYILKISIWDHAGNRKDEIIIFTVDLLMVGFIMTHDEASLWNIRDYCINQGYITEDLYYGTTVTREWLDRFDIVFIGYGGYTPWSSTELTALEDYLNSGGNIVYIHYDYYDPPLLPWLSSLGITKVDNGPGSHYTTTFLHSHPLFSDISQIYLYYAYDSWDLTGDAYPIVWSEDGLYQLIGIIERMGSLIVIAGNFDNRLYYAENYEFLANIFQYATLGPREGISISYETLISNTSFPTISWLWNLENTSLEYFEVYIDSNYLGNTIETNWTFSSLSEGVYNVTIILVDNMTHQFSDSEYLIVDKTAPNILTSKQDGDTIGVNQLFFDWNSTDESSGIFKEKIYWKTPFNASWNELWYDPYMGSSITLYFPENGNYEIKISAWDQAGNRKDEIIRLTVEMMNIGFISSHGEDNLDNIRYYCQNLGALTDTLYSSDVSFEWLIQFDVVFIGYSGYEDWTNAELEALNDYYYFGGWIVFIHRENYDTPLEEWLQQKGFTLSDQGPGSLWTNNTDQSHPLCLGINDLYFYRVYASWSLSGLVTPIVWSSDGQYTIVGILDEAGSIVGISGDIERYVYDYDNDLFISNILNEAKISTKGGIIPHGASIQYINQNTFQLSWRAYPPKNSSIDIFEVYVNSTLLGTTNEQFWDFSDLIETTYNITIIMVLDNFERKSGHITLIVDTSDPIIQITDPSDGAKINQKLIQLRWNVIDQNPESISFRVEIWNPSENKWDVLVITNELYADIEVQKVGMCQIRVTGIDMAKNQGFDEVTLDITLLKALLITSHGEQIPLELYNYYTEYMIIETIRTELDTTDLVGVALVIIPYGGEDEWDSSEIKSLATYIMSGGKVLIFGPYLPQSLANLLVEYNLEFHSGVSYDEAVTKSYDLSHPLFDNINEFYLPSGMGHLSVTESSKRLVSTTGGDYIVIGLYEDKGAILAIACPLQNSIHNKDVRQFFYNILVWVGLNNPSMINLIPSVRVISPNGGEMFRGNISITWNANDPENELLTFTLEVWDGTTWSRITSGLTTNEYLWDSSTLPDGIDIYKIRITASDGINSAQDESDNFFSIENKTGKSGSGFHIHLTILILLLIPILSRRNFRRKFISLKKKNTD